MIPLVKNITPYFCSSSSSRCLEGTRLTLIMLVIVLIPALCASEICFSEEIKDESQAEISIGMHITKAVTCEDVKDGRPVNEGIIFSSDLNRVTCFTEFDQITEKTIIYHCWYFKDNLRAKKKPLVLNPPRWATFSQIEPRETEKGPWRVEIVDEDGNILRTLRFSIVD